MHFTVPVSIRFTQKQMEQLKARVPQGGSVAGVIRDIVVKDLQTKRITLITSGLKPSALDTDPLLNEALQHLEDSER